MLEGLLSPEECAAIAGLYPDDTNFRSRVVMGRHGFGRGRIQVFLLPVAELVAELRPALYPRLVADRQSLERGDGDRRPLSRTSRRLSWSAAMTPARRGPRRCCCNTTPATTTACIRISTASTCSRSRWRSCCRNPADDFSGGEFVLTEQRPRMQSRPEVVPLRAGRRGGVRRSPPAGAGDARLLPRQPAPWREPGPLRPPPHRGRSFFTMRSDAGRIDGRSVRKLPDRTPFARGDGGGAVLLRGFARPAEAD